MLLTILVSLVAYASASEKGPFGFGRGAASGLASEDCPAYGAPQVVTVDRDRVVKLRRELEQLSASLSPDGLTPYEAGLAPAESAWTDGEPGLEREPPDESPLSAGYEMRWWLPNMDNLLANIWVFESTESAAEFFERTVGTECRVDGKGSAIPYIPSARNVEWRNPAGYMQQDVFLQRGPRVYRVTVVRPGSEHPSNALKRQRAFLWVNAIACALPEADCRKAMAPSIPTAA